MTEAAPVLVTGAAGFVGYHVANALLDRPRRKGYQLPEIAEGS